MEPIRSLFEDDPDMAELVRGFASELPARATSLEELLSQNDLPELQRLAHQLKGAGGGYGFPQITDAAAGLEQAIKDGAEESILKEHTGIVCEVLRAVRAPE
jgi:HPt (histidine-containing phosphotransfer) domain-containing protein